jgi:hypothetical protein
VTYTTRAEQRADQAAMRAKLAALAGQQAGARRQDAERERARRFLLDTLEAQMRRDPAVIAGSEAGLSIREIARISGLARGTVVSILARRGLEKSR